MKTFILIILTSSFFSLKSQVQVVSTFGKSNIGWNFRLGAEYFPIQNLSFGIGTRIIYFPNLDNYSTKTYRDKFYPATLKENFGFYSNINYYPLKKIKTPFQPSISYDFSYSKASLRWNLYEENFNPTTGLSTGTFTRKLVIFNPLNAFEHYLTFGLDIEIYKGIILTEKYGIGVSHFSGYDANQPYVLLATTPDDKFEFSWLFFNIGLKYDFSNLIKKKKEKAPNKTYK